MDGAMSSRSGSGGEWLLTGTRSDDELGEHLARCTIRDVHSTPPRRGNVRGTSVPSGQEHHQLDENKVSKWKQKVSAVSLANREGMCERQSPFQDKKHAQR